MPPRKTARAATAATLPLASVLDVCAAGPLHGALRGLRGRAVVLEAGEVQRLGGQCLQVLLAAAAAWRRDGVALSVGSVSDGFRDALSLFGFSVDTLLGKDAQ